MAEDEGPILRGGTYKVIHPQHFRNRLEELYLYWQQYNAQKFGDSSVLIIETPKPYHGLRSSASSIFHIWLFGVEFPETTIVFHGDQIYLICKDDDHTPLFEVLGDTMDGLGKEMITYIMGREYGGVQEMDHVVHRIRETDQAIRVGCTREWDHEGEVSIFFNWYTQRKPTYLHYIDVTDAFSELFTLKNKVERSSLKKSGELNHRVMDRCVVGILRYIVEKQVNYSHVELSRKIQKVILNSWMVQEPKHERVNICYPPVLQSGNEFNLRPDAVSNNDILFYGSQSVIVCGIGSSYNDHCSYLARTYFISPTAYQKNVYEILLQAQKCAIKALRPGIKVRDVYERARYTVQLLGYELLPHLTGSAGSGIGIKFYESILDVNPSNEMVVKPGMVFNISLGFENVIDQSTPYENMFSMLLGDTVIVRNNGRSVITPSEKRFDCVTYPFEAKKDMKSKLPGC